MIFPRTGHKDWRWSSILQMFCH